MKSQTGRPGGTCSASVAKMEGDLRTNWQHPCFQCNCTYLLSHLRGSFRGSGLIEQSVAEWRRERSQAEQIFGPLRPSQNFLRGRHVGHFQSACLNRSSTVSNKCSRQFSFYRILSDHYFTALLPPAHSNGSDTPL